MDVHWQIEVRVVYVSLLPAEARVEERVRRSMSEQAQDWQTGTGDMPPEEFRKYGHRVVEWIAQYMEKVEEFPVLSPVHPGDVTGALPRATPPLPESLDAILHDFDSIIMPGITHWNHPAFLAYFSITGSAPGVLGEMLAAALNVNAMLWRTSPAATELESTVLDWLRQLIGLPEGWSGVIYDTASVSTLVAIAAARETASLEVREKGMIGRPNVPRLRMYCSDHAHSSIEKAALTLGIGLEGVRKISVDSEYRMDTEVLRSALDDDTRAGWKPFCVVATVGTTSTTSVDPVPEIADLCEKYGIWLHVDAAYAGMAAILPEMRCVMQGVERADSMVTNPHKWLFTPVDCSAFFSRRLETVRAAFSLVPPAYLQTKEGESVIDYMNYGPQLGRRFRALKLWFVLRAYGQEGIQTRLRHHIQLARQFVSWIDANPDWEVMAPTPFSTVCFRAHPQNVSEDRLDSLNLEIEDFVNSRGDVFLSHTSLEGKVTLRVAVGNLRTEIRHLQSAWESLQEGLRISAHGHV
jgi:aromatic-L-amino-acid decarboxylase